MQRHEAYSAILFISFLVQCSMTNDYFSSIGRSGCLHARTVAISNLFALFCMFSKIVDANEQLWGKPSNTMAAFIYFSLKFWGYDTKKKRFQWQNCNGSNIKFFPLHFLSIIYMFFFQFHCLLNFVSLPNILETKMSAWLL